MASGAGASPIDESGNYAVRSPQVAMDGSGGAFVLWFEYAGTKTINVKARRFSAGSWGTTALFGIDTTVDDTFFTQIASTVMMMLTSRDSEILTKELRPMTRAEYEKLAAEDFFGDEKVELLFGLVVAMTPIDPAHAESTYVVGERLRGLLRGRARVYTQSPFAASDISEPEPDAMVVPTSGREWRAHPERAFLVVEVSRSSLVKDRGPKVTLYGLAHVDEYWIVNHVDEVVEVYRDRRPDGTWVSIQCFGRGATIQMLAFPDVTIAIDDVLPPPGV